MVQPPGMNSELRRLLNRNAGVITLADVYRAGVYAALKHMILTGTQRPAGRQVAGASLSRMG